MLAKTPVTIVTGFLGAGKTTLIRHLMANAGGRRLALIINEFGDVGVDGDLVKGCADAACPEEAIIELANGCICCTVADDFAPAMTALIAREPKPDHIVVETSGLALPKPLIKAFDWPELRTRLTVDGVVAVVDAAAVAEGRFADDPARVAEQRLKRPVARPRQSARGGLRGPAHERRSRRAQQGRSCRPGPARTRCARRSPEPCRARSRSRPRARARSAPTSCSACAPRPRTISNARPSHHDAEGEHDHDDFDTFVVAIPAVGDPDALHRPPHRGDARARHPARQGLRRSRRQADADAGARGRAALPPRLRAPLGRKRAAPEPSRRDRPAGASTARPSPRRSGA